MPVVFRNSIFDSNSMAFGCSHTWGTGVDVHESWPHLLSAKNYGLPGISADFVVRYARQIALKETPTTIFVLWPDWSRFEYMKDDEYYQSLPTDDNRINFMQTHNVDWCRDNFSNSVKILHDFCLQHSINLVDMTLYNLIPYLDHADCWPLSKPGHHYAPEWHAQVADLFSWAKNNNYKFTLAYE